MLINKELRESNKHNILDILLKPKILFDTVNIRFDENDLNWHIDENEIVECKRKELYMGITTLDLFNALKILSPGIKWKEFYNVYKEIFKSYKNPLKYTEEKNHGIKDKELIHYLHE